MTDRVSYNLERLTTSLQLLDCAENTLSTEQTKWGMHVISCQFLSVMPIADLLQRD